MAERSARIEGARKEAAEIEAAAKKELDDYNEALRKARGEIYAEQETARQAVLEDRARLLKAMRARTQETVEAAKKRIAADFAASRVEVERTSPMLANEIVRMIILAEAVHLHKERGGMIRVTRLTGTTRTSLRCGCSLVLFLILTAAPLLAQEGQTPAADTTVGWIFRWLNFAIVFGGIAYLLATKAGPVFRPRAEAIAQAIGEAARAREAAEQQRRETAAKLANLQNEVVEMRAAAKRDAEAEAQRLRALAKSEAEKIEQIAQGWRFAAAGACVAA